MLLCLSTGYQRKSFPMTYIGCPLYTERKTRRLFTPVVNKLQDILDVWKGKLLSAGGKLTLSRHILQSVPIYYLTLIDPLKLTVRDINRVIANFFWHRTDGNIKCHFGRRKKGAWFKKNMPV